MFSKNSECTEVDGIHPATKVTGILPSFFVNRAGLLPWMYYIGTI